MQIDEKHKRSTGAYMTSGDAFQYDCVADFISEYVIPYMQKKHNNSISICEPYCGTGALIQYFNSHFETILHDIRWSAYDINLPAADKMLADIAVNKADTLLSLPEYYDMIVTNPPYLARNSARRRGLSFPFDVAGIGMKKPQDLYQFALDTCLSHAALVIALIPESFITSSYNKERLRSVLSLPGNLFQDTECPVCLAMFSDESKTDNDYEIHSYDNGLLGTWHSINEKNNELLHPSDNTYANIHFNMPYGIIGLHGVDSTNDSRIHFVEGNTISPDSIKVSSRAITRITIDGLQSPEEARAIIEQANILLNEWRNATNDIFLTAFKGTRNDGRYRRRLSYKIAADILSASMQQLNQNKHAVS